MNKSDTSVHLELMFVVRAKYLDFFQPCRVTTVCLHNLTHPQCPIYRKRK